MLLVPSLSLLVRVVKLAGENRYLARSRTYKPGNYFELWVSA